MAPVEADSDRRVTTKKKLRIVFLYSEGREFQPDSTRHWQTIQTANAANRSDERTKSAAKCGQIYGGPMVNCDC
jgi:hypothetical protein